MAVLEKIRVKFGVLISVIIALALLSFLIDPSTVESALNSMSSKYDVGKINGKSVSYSDFLEDVDRYTAINELLSGSSLQSEEQRQQVQNAAWQELVDKYLFVENAKKAGLVVGRDEMVALTTGDIISPVISQNMAFADENGNFAPENVLQFVNSLDADPSGQLRTYWNYVQNTVYSQQFYTKYGSLFNASTIQNPLELRRAIEENNTTAEVDFVMIPFGLTTDSTVVVTNQEIKDYYNSHKYFFKQNASRDIEYVVFEVKPSDDDFTKTNEEIASLHTEFAQASNMKSFLQRNSERPLSEFWYKEGELNTISRDVNEFVFSNPVGAVSPVIQDGETFYAAKVLGAENRADSVYVKHILLQGEDTAKADSLCAVVKKNPSSFATVAALYTSDRGSADEGEIGNIGWMTQYYMIAGMEAVLDAKVGEPFVLTTQYGTHVILVSQATKPVAKKQVAILEKTVTPSRETVNTYYSQANAFSKLANGKYEGYLKAVDSLGVYSHPISGLLESASSIGSIDQAKEVTRWAFEAKKGKVSDIITINNTYFIVAALTGIHKEGYATVSEVATQINQKLYNDKAAQSMAAQVANTMSGLTSLEEIAEKVGSSVNEGQSVTFSSIGNPNLDPAFVGAVAAAPQGQICGPVAGSYAVYVFKVNNRDTGSYYTEDDAKIYASQMSQYNTQMILPVMAENTVTDNRARFF